MVGRTLKATIDLNIVLKLNWISGISFWVYLSKTTQYIIHLNQLGGLMQTFYGSVWYKWRIIYSTENSWLTFPTNTNRNLFRWDFIILCEEFKYRIPSVVYRIFESYQATFRNHVKRSSKYQFRKKYNRATPFLA